MYPARALLLTVCQAALTWGGFIQAAEPGNAPPSFTSDIAPILDRHCVVCHGPDKAKGRFRVDSFEDLLKPGSSDKPPIVPYHPEASQLYQLITESNPDDRMPQKAEPLPATEIELLRRWIADGAQFDGPSPTAPLASILPKPKGAAAPERYRTFWPITALSFAGEGTQLMASGYHEVTFWEPLTGTLTHRTGGLPERIRAIACQPGTSLVAIAGGAPGRSGEVLLFDSVSDLPPTSLVSTRDEILCAAFSTDGTRLAVGGADSSVRVFDISSRREQLKLEQHSDWVYSVAFSPNTGWLASASRDRTARISDAMTGDVRSIFRSHEAAVQWIAFIEQGQSMVTAGADRHLRSWDTSDAGHAHDLASFDTDVTACLSTDQSALVGLADGRVTERRLTDGSPSCAFGSSGERVTALAFQANHRWLAAGSHDGRVRLWDETTGQSLSAFTACPGFETAAHETR